MADAICQRFLNRDALEAAGFPVGGFAWAETTGDGDITAHLQLCVPGDFDPPGEPIPWRFRVFPVYREGGPVPRGPPGPGMATRTRRRSAPPSAATAVSGRTGTSGTAS